MDGGFDELSEFIPSRISSSLRRFSSWRFFSRSAASNVSNSAIRASGAGRLSIVGDGASGVGMAAGSCAFTTAVDYTTAILSILLRRHGLDRQRRRGGGRRDATGSSLGSNHEARRRGP